MAASEQVKQMAISSIAGRERRRWGCMGKGGQKEGGLQVDGSVDPSISHHIFFIDMKVPGYMTWIIQMVVEHMIPRNLFPPLDLRWECVSAGCFSSLGARR